MNIYNKFKLNLNPILSLSLKILGSIFTMFAIVLSFVSWEEIGVTKVGTRLLILLVICILSFISSSLLVVLVLKRKRIWTKGKNSVYAQYGDLFKMSFIAKEKNSRIVVIPFNDTFDTIVESISEKINKPLVSPNSIHGQWIGEYCDKMGITVEELDARIQKNLEVQEIKPKKIYTREEKERGNLKSYDIGTIATIDGPNEVKFLLLVISTFDSNNNARSTKRIVRESVEDLIEYYDSKGQSDQLYMPLIGTGNSRADLTHEQSLRVIKSCILDSDKKVHGEINVVVYEKDRDKVSIFK